MSEKKEKKIKTSVEHRQKTGFVKMCAFWGIFLAALVMFVNFIIALLDKIGVTVAAFGTVSGILNILSMVALFIAIAFPAYSFVRGKGKAWKILYWVALILYICGLIGIGIASF